MVHAFVMTEVGRAIRRQSRLVYCPHSLLPWLQLISYGEWWLHYVPMKKCQCLLKVPFSTSTLNQTGAFNVAGPRLWNELPCALWSTPSYNVFRVKLKTFIKTTFWLVTNNAITILASLYEYFITYFIFYGIVLIYIYIDCLSLLQHIMWILC